jgi:hypothetical protein
MLRLIGMERRYKKMIYQEFIKELQKYFFVGIRRDVTSNLIIGHKWNEKKVSIIYEMTPEAYRNIPDFTEHLKFCIKINERNVDSLNIKTVKIIDLKPAVVLT